MFAKFARLGGAKAVLEAAGFEEFAVPGAAACLLLPEESLAAAAAIAEKIDAALAKEEGH